MTKEELQAKQKLHAQLYFIHQVLTQSTRYDVNEFEVAKDAIVMITGMTNTIKSEIEAELAKEVQVEQVEA